MATPLNLYATKVFSEHPLGLWPLDDVSNYISLVNTAEQDLSSWTFTGLSAVADAYGGSPFTETPPPQAPFKNEYTNGLIGTTDNLGIVTFTSPRAYQPSDFSEEIQTVAISLYAYSYAKIVDVRLGIRYTDPDNPGIPNEIIKSASATPTLEWSGISETFQLPQSFEDLYFILEFYYRNDSEVYQFAVNGISVGQWAEEYQFESLGVRELALLDSENIANIPSGQYGVEAQPYGLQGANGYYLVEDNYLLGKNNGLPLVYGTRNSTAVNASATGKPSIVVPGFGFMNSAGNANNLTAEFWIKISPKAVEPRKIFGPVGSRDGLYVDGPFLKLRVGGQFISHFVREWDRPMLVDIRINSEVADLLVNGAVVGTIERLSSYTLPSLTNSSNKDLNWLGFYSYSDISNFYLDCIAIYPYFVSADVAKRRWVYGQAVKVPADIKGINTANSVVVDYSFANYAKNYSFPRTSNWSSGLIENLVVEEDRLQMPTHPLPEVKFNQPIDSNNWLEALGRVNTNTGDTFITLRPDLHTTDEIFSSNLSLDFVNRLQTSQGYLVYNNMNFLSEQTKAFYGIFQTATDSDKKQTLFKIVNNLTNDYVEIYLDQVDYNGVIENDIIYSFNTFTSEGQYQEDIFYRSRGQQAGDRFLVGLDIPRFVRDKGGRVANFFSARQRLTMYIGGTPEYLNTYEGLIRRIAFCNGRNLNKIQHLFTKYGVPVDYENVFNLFGPSSYDAGADYFGSNVDSQGNAITPPPAYWSLILDGGSPYDFVTIGAEEHTATYTLQAKKYDNNFYLDIGCNSYWEDYVPVSYFTKNIVDGTGDSRKSLSFIQFNLGYPVIENIVGSSFNFNGAMLKPYISFQYLSSGASSISSSLTNTVPLNKNKILKPGPEWLYSKYEVVNGAVIYPPQGVSFDSLSIKVHLEFEVDSIYTNPINIRSLELSSQTLNDSPTRIGTKLGKNIIPFKRAGVYFSYRDVSPFSIYKQSSPYLYNTANSGIQMLGEYSNTFNSGLSIPLNESVAPFFSISSAQIALRYSEDLMPQVPVKIFEIISAEDPIDFYLIADSLDRKRGQIYAINRNTYRLQSGIFYFTNGVPTKRPVLYPNSWSFIAISFPEFLKFNRTLGALRFTSPIRFDNVSFYETTKADDDARFGYRQWFAVRNNLGEDLDWGYWAGKEVVGEEIVVIPGAGFAWDDVLKKSAIVREEIDGKNVYNIYTGTERIIADSDNALSINDYEYNFYKNVRWKKNIVTPA